MVTRCRRPLLIVGAEKRAGVSPPGREIGTLRVNANKPKSRPREERQADDPQPAEIAGI